MAGRAWWRGGPEQNAIFGWFPGNTNESWVSPKMLAFLLVSLKKRHPKRGAPKQDILTWLRCVDSLLAQLV